MFYEKIIQHGAALHVATVADALFNGEFVSFRSGKRRKLPLHGHAMSGNRPFAIFYDTVDGMFEIYEANTNRPGLVFIEAVTGEQLNKRAPQFQVFLHHK